MKMFKGLATWAMVLTLMSLAAGCAPQDTTTNEMKINLDGTTWTLLEMKGETTPADAEATLDFTEEQVGGVAFCNRFFGPYEVDGESLSFGMLGSTMMACPNMESESQYLEALSAVVGYHGDGDNLILTNADGDAVLLFSPAEHAALESTKWQLTGYNTGNAISSLIPETGITVTMSDGQIEGSAGCNTYFASYTLDGSAIEVGPVANTEMFCMEPEGVMDQEADYLAALGIADTYEINRNTLEFFDAQGMRLLTYVAASE